MESKLFNYYSIDECVNDKKLYVELDKYVDNGTLEYKIESNSVIKIVDLDLTDGEIDSISKLFDSLDVFPYLDYDDDYYESEDSYDDDFE